MVSRDGVLCRGGIESRKESKHEDKLDTGRLRSLPRKRFLVSRQWQQWTKEVMSFEFASKMQMQGISVTDDAEHNAVAAALPLESSEKDENTHSRLANEVRVGVWHSHLQVLKSTQPVEDSECPWLFSKRPFFQGSGKQTAKAQPSKVKPSWPKSGSVTVSTAHTCMKTCPVDPLLRHLQCRGPAADLPLYYPLSTKDGLHDQCYLFSRPRTAHLMLRISHVCLQNTVECGSSHLRFADRREVYCFFGKLRSHLEKVKWLDFVFCCLFSANYMEWNGNEEKTPNDLDPLYNSCFI